MLNAILNSKAGRLSTDDERSIRWRELFKDSEDLVTATVLERLSYLSPEVAWRLLVDAASGQLPAYRVAELVDVEFWPMWEVDDRKRGVEPDAFLSLKLGDPTRHIHIILEAKHGGAQRANQWAAEIGAWKESVASEDERLPDLLVLLAIEGNVAGWEREDQLQAFFERMRKQHADLPELRVVMIEWKDIARACSNFTSSFAHEQRIITDIQSGLELCGYFHLVVPEQLEHLAKRPLASFAFDQLMGANVRASEGR